MGRIRADVSLPEVEIGPATRQIDMEIRLQDASAEPCDVRLALANPATPADKKIVWSKDQMQPLKSRGTALLIFDLPTDGIKPAESSCSSVSVLGISTRFSILLRLRLLNKSQNPPNYFRYVSQL